MRFSPPVANSLCPTTYTTYRMSDGGVEVELIDDVLRLPPPSFFISPLMLYKGRKDAVVVVMVERVGFRLGHGDLGQPLDHTSTNVTCQSCR